MKVLIWLGGFVLYGIAYTVFQQKAAGAIPTIVFHVVVVPIVLGITLWAERAWETRKSQTIICPKCGHKNFKERSVCTNCGAALPEKNFASKKLDKTPKAASTRKNETGERMQTNRKAIPQQETAEICFCRKCGSRLPANSVYCNKCGTKVERNGT